MLDHLKCSSSNSSLTPTKTQKLKALASISLSSNFNDAGRHVDTNGRARMQAVLSGSVPVVATEIQDNLAAGKLPEFDDA
jgi:hypothetical protein